MQVYEKYAKCENAKVTPGTCRALDPSQISNPAPPDLNLRKRFSTVSFEEGLRFSIEKFLHIKRGHHPNRVEPLMSRKLPKNKRKEKNNNFIKKRKNNICI